MELYPATTCLRERLVIGGRVCYNGRDPSIYHILTTLLDRYCQHLLVIRPPRQHTAQGYVSHPSFRVHSPYSLNGACTTFECLLFLGPALLGRPEDVKRALIRSYSLYSFEALLRAIDNFRVYLHVTLSSEASDMRSPRPGTSDNGPRGGL